MALDNIDKVIETLSPINLVIEAKLMKLISILAHKNNDLPNLDPKQLTFDNIKKITWRNDPKYWGPFYGSTVTIQTVVMEFVELITENIEKIRKRFPNVIRFEANLVKYLKENGINFPTVSSPKMCSNKGL